MKRPKPQSLPTSVQKTLFATTDSTNNGSSSSSLAATAPPSLSSQSPFPSPPTTELLVQLFSDRIFIVISQRSGKLGTLLQCTHEHSMIDNSHTYHVDTLLGKRDDTPCEVYVRQITERIVQLGLRGGNSAGTASSVKCPPILLGIALKKDDGSSGTKTHEMFQTIINEVLDLYREAIRIASSSSCS